MEFTTLCNKSYLSIVKRGKITKNTTLDDLMEKLEEEHQEVKNARADMLTAITDSEKIQSREHFIEEVTDLMNVCINKLLFLGREPEEELLKVINKNEIRND